MTILSVKLYEEGPWLYKRNNIYYLFWPGGPLPEHIGYSTSDSPTGPWKYGGVVMPAQGGSFTIHPGVIDFRGNTYFSITTAHFLEVEV